MLTQLPQKFSIQPIIDQVNSLIPFKRLELNLCKGEFFNDPWELNPVYKDTPIGEVLDSLGPIGQARLLALDSSESYTAHCDPDDRIHLAIQTNPYCFLVDLDENKLHHLPVDGQLWHMDTSRIHVATNWGPRTRIHLNVRVLLPKYDATQPGLRIKVIEGDYDWKQLAYTPIMKLINNGVKNKVVTGFKGVSEREILVNTTSLDFFKSAFDSIRSNNILLTVETL